MLIEKHKAAASLHEAATKQKQRAWVKDMAEARRLEQLKKKAQLTAGQKEQKGAEKKEKAEQKYVARKGARAMAGRKAVGPEWQLVAVDSALRECVQQDPNELGMLAACSATENPADHTPRPAQTGKRNDRCEHDMDSSQWWEPSSAYPRCDSPQRPSSFCDLQRTSVNKHPVSVRRQAFL